MNKALLQSIAYAYAHKFNDNQFGLKLPFVVKITQAKKFNDSCYAEWSMENFVGINEPDTEYHVIIISFDRHYNDLQELQNSIFHEFCHAWQFEHDYDTEHNESFWRWQGIAEDIGLTIRYPDDNYMEFIK